MTDDELTERLRRTFDDHAATVHAPDDAWERFQQVAPMPLAHARRGRWYGTTAGVLAAAAAIAVAVVVTRGSSNHSTHVAIAAAPTTTPAINAAPSTFNPAHPPTTPHPPEAALPAASGASGTATASTGFWPQSVTFVSPSEGWVLGSVACGINTTCPPAMRHTVDGGRTWTSVTPPPAAATVIRFADPRDGWAWDRIAGIWSTHDGGGTWTHVTVPGLATQAAIEDLEASAGVAHVALTQDDGTVRLADTPVGADAWTLSPTTVTLGGGPVPNGQLVLQGSAGWFIQVDRTVVAGARLVGGSWQPWTPPCATVQGPATLAASSPTDLLAVCDVGLWSTPVGEELFVSHDGGTTWSAGVKIPVTSGGEVAAASRSTIVLAADAGLVASFDGGSTWSTVAQLSGVTDLGFTTPTQGVAVIPGESPALVTTRDGGHTWTPVTFP